MVQTDGQTYGQTDKGATLCCCFGEHNNSFLHPEVHVVTCFPIKGAG